MDSSCIYQHSRVASQTSRVASQTKKESGSNTPEIEKKCVLRDSNSYHEQVPEMGSSYSTLELRTLLGIYSLVFWYMYTSNCGESGQGFSRARKVTRLEIRVGYLPLTISSAFILQTSIAVNFAFRSSLHPSYTATRTTLWPSNSCHNQMEHSLHEASFAMEVFTRSIVDLILSKEACNRHLNSLDQSSSACHR